MNYNFQQYIPTQNSIDYLVRIPQAFNDLDVLGDEIEAARNGQASLLLSIQQRLPTSSFLTWGQSVNANGFTINGLPNATQPSQPTTLAQVNSLILGGGNPNEIAITDLNKGIATNGQYLSIVANAVVGIDLPTMNKAERMFFS